MMKTRILHCAIVNLNMSGLRELVNRKMSDLSELVNLKMSDLNESINLTPSREKEAYDTVCDGLPFAACVEANRK